MIGHLWNNVYYATSNWLIGTASVLNVLLLNTQAKATDFLSHPPERIKQDCIKTQIKVNLLILSGAIIIGMLLENDHTVCKNTGMKLYTIFYYTVRSLFVCLRLLLSYLYPPAILQVSYLSIRVSLFT